MSNKTAKSLSRLYAEPHGSIKGIDPEKLGPAYDHMKDFRNVRAHDERFCCARATKAGDILVRDLRADLEIAPTAKDHAEPMRSTCDLVESVEGPVAPQVDVATRMGW